MRIITGKLKGRRIHIPKGLEVRPTTDRTKESIFNKIEAYKYLDKNLVLDLFSGSGSLGFEAISRGVERVTFVESDSKNVDLIRKVAEQFGVSDQIYAQADDVLEFVERRGTPFDLIFCDPPYDYPFMDELIDNILANGWLAEEGWFILEHDKYHKYKEHPHCFFSKAYGRTTVSIFQKEAVLNTQ